MQRLRDIAEQHLRVIVPRHPPTPTQPPGGDARPTAPTASFSRSPPGRRLTRSDLQQAGACKNPADCVGWPRRRRGRCSRGRSLLGRRRGRLARACGWWRFDRSTLPRVSRAASLLLSPVSTKSSTFCSSLIDKAQTNTIFFRCGEDRHAIAYFIIAEDCFCFRSSSGKLLDQEESLVHPQHLQHLQRQPLQQANSHSSSTTENSLPIYPAQPLRCCRSPLSNSKQNLSGQGILLSQPGFLQQAKLYVEPIMRNLNDEVAAEIPIVFNQLRQQRWPIPRSLCRRICLTKSFWCVSPVGSRMPAAPVL